MKEYNQLGVLVLAAGGSTRLGQPKQLLKYQNTYLLDHCLNTLAQLKAPISIVLGAYDKQIIQNINLDQFDIVINTNWAKGIGSSIKKGVERTNYKYSFDHLLITLTDLPLITNEDYQNLVDHHISSNKKMTFSTYDSAIGVPAIFNKQLFPELIDIEDSNGAKIIYKKYHSYAQVFEMKNASFDIDTISDYEKLMKL